MTENSASNAGGREIGRAGPAARKSHRSGARVPPLASPTDAVMGLGISRHR